MKVIGYQWRLRQVMAERGLFNTAKLGPLLRERGIDLSASQVYRLVAEKPERLNLHVLVALMDILSCGCEDLIVAVDLGAAASTGTDDEHVSESGASVLKERGLRPRRARILPGSDHG